MGGWSKVSLAKLVVLQYDWKTAGTLTTAQAALTTDKSKTTVNNLTSTGRVIITPNNNTVAIDLRFRGGSDGDINVINLYAMRAETTADHYTLITTATLTTGTQTDGTNLFIDTIDNSAFEKWGDDIVVMSDGANGIAHIELNTHGYSHFMICATTLNSTSLLIDWARV